MENLAWTGALGPFLVPVIIAAAVVLAVAVIARILVSLAAWVTGAPAQTTVGPVLVARRRGLGGTLDLAAQAAIGVILLSLILIALAGFVLPAQSKGILGWAALRFWPVWAALIVTFALSIHFKRKLGLYGKLMDSPVGMVGLGIVLFWVFTAIFATTIIT